MTRFFSNFLIVLIFAALCHVQMKDASNEKSDNLKLINRCMLSPLITKRSSTKLLGKAVHSNIHNVVMFLLVCSGDVSPNPGPIMKDFSNKLHPRIRSLVLRTYNVQKKMIEGMLHATYLKKYAKAEVPPPGLQFRKYA